MTIVWTDYVFRGPRPVVGPEDVERLEATWGVKLPEEYKQIVWKYHGMSPEPAVFEIGRGGNVFTCLLTLTSDEHERAYSIAAMHELIKQYIPEGVFPFGTTPGGEDLCFDYRDSPDEPRIVLVSVEMDIYPVADSFREFLEGLHELRE